MIEEIKKESKVCEKLRVWWSFFIFNKKWFFLVLGIILLIVVFIFVRGDKGLVKGNSLMTMRLDVNKERILEGDEFEVKVIVELGKDKVLGMGIPLLVSENLEPLSVEVNKDVFDVVMKSEVLPGKVLISALVMREPNALVSGDVEVAKIRFIAKASGKVKFSLEEKADLVVLDKDRKISLILKEEEIGVY